jgi:chaperone required for assembly of F1-ATPase
VHDAGHQRETDIIAIPRPVEQTGSLVLALALLKGAADADAVWQAAHVDEDFQAEISGWGWCMMPVTSVKRTS